MPVRRRPARATRPTQGIGQREGCSLRAELRFAAPPPDSPRSAPARTAAASCPLSRRVGFEQRESLLLDPGADEGLDLLSETSESARQRSAATVLLPGAGAGRGARRCGRSGPQIALDHPHHRSALLVGDQVEVLGGLVRAPHLGVDGVGVRRASMPSAAERDAGSRATSATRASRRRRGERPSRWRRPRSARDRSTRPSSRGRRTTCGRARGRSPRPRVCSPGG